MGWDGTVCKWCGWEEGALVIRMPDRDEVILKAEQKEGDRETAS
jgi:hypothetical protein